jgi:putative exosortase-associated protein (TIGR04073 family)
MKPMKIFISCSAIFLSLAVFCPLSFAADNPAQKFNRGLINIITSPLEIAKQINKGWKQSAKESKPAGKGIFSGFFKGIAYSAGRLGSGVWDVVTFPVKTPKNYAPLMKPEFVTDKDTPVTEPAEKPTK